ncbi:MAG TPA: tetratricopeptide repeat protein [Pyrinomonadaceae bacterium]|jgi:tetratricopeptide (TPR) repeat protein
MQKNSILFGIVGLVVGLIVGFFAANSINRSAISQQTAAPNQSNAPFASQQAANVPNNAAAGGMLADVQEKLDKAKSEPSNFAAQMNAGDMYAQIGRYDQAFAFYQKGVELKPDSFEANVQLANAYFDNRQFENAEKYYARALEINPKDVNARTDLGTTFVERQTPDYARAVAEFKKALEVDPKHEPTLYNLGVAYSRMSDAENADKTFAQLEQTNPNSPLVDRLKQILTAK